MLLSLVLHTYSMRYLLPSVVLLGSAPTYLLAWALWRVLSALLPARLYQRVDDRLYCVYQNMVLFFFENYTGVQVRPGSDGAAFAACSLPPPLPQARAAAPGLPPRVAVGRGRSFWCSLWGSFWKVLLKAERVPGCAPPPPPVGCSCPSRCPAK